MGYFLLSLLPTHTRSLALKKIVEVLNTIGDLEKSIYVS